MRIVVPLAALLLAVASPLAHAAPAPQAASAADARAEKDRAIVQKAMGSNDLKTIRKMVPQLEDVASRTPAAYPLIEEKDGAFVVRSGSLGPGLLASLSTGVAASKARPDQSARVDMQFNTYGLALFLLGSAAVEARDFDRANAWLDKGLALQPDNLMLVTEKGMVLTAQRRFPDALALYDATFEKAGVFLTSDQQGKARLLRSRGFALIELGRLDEAEADYKASLEIEPNHGGAKHELGYIAQLRAGAQATGLQIMNGEEAMKPK
ncbi:hypothetical protein CFHF_13115 [Caulobacter flavus]|uniref:Uncharacterized protein n=1 Tax=Caulobacter flavus TaxID=1679497 RepID=A0A2N5CTC1_9CAUL|nr:tetratricopeptide repeat protein [Caulobacter flavus]AYV49253.1 hypothetical protein C1707_25060 [Caulobacter flavus]PLR14899.1 hypothetical protein CFHF_13115 [Caulobacter flavus]